MARIRIIVPNLEYKIVSKRSYTTRRYLDNKQTNRWISSSGDYILLSANVSSTYSPEELIHLFVWFETWWQTLRNNM